MPVTSRAVAAVRKWLAARVAAIRRLVRPEPDEAGRFFVAALQRATEQLNQGRRDEGIATLKAARDILAEKRR